MGTLQWRPNKSFETTLDVFQSKGKQANFKKGIEGFIGGNSDPHNYRGSPSLSNAVVANGIATSGTVNNFKGVIRNHKRRQRRQAQCHGPERQVEAQRLGTGWRRCQLQGHQEQRPL